MYGLAKVAFESNRMSEEQFEEYTNQLKGKYGLNDVDYVMDDAPVGFQSNGVVFADPKKVEKIQNSKFRRLTNGLVGYSGDGSRIVKVSPYEEAILHETGKVMNPDYLENERKGKRWERGTSLGLSTTIAPTLAVAGFTGNPKLAIGAGLGLSGLGIAGAGKSYRHYKDNHDQANEFVKKHWTEELGSREEAEEQFNNSMLAQDYQKGNVMRPYYEVLSGTAGGIGNYIGARVAGSSIKPWDIR